ncbi:MAG TPA: hypothetical protein VJL29_05825 [Thermoguttaceae bacterium]|nr:hypothetical protein [Thermoguttaceae bacterium]
MKRLWIAIAVTLFVVPTAGAQDSSSDGPKSASGAAPAVAASSGQVTATPEMWFYEQRLREYMDPKLSVRRVAEERSAQRRARIAARMWYGYSNLRPVASPDPYNGDYSPGWGGNNSMYPHLWSGYGPSYVVVRPYASYR